MIFFAMLKRRYNVLTEVAVEDLIESIRRFLHAFTILELIVLGCQLFYHFVRTDSGGGGRYLVCVICRYGMRKVMEESPLMVLLLTWVTLFFTLFQILSEATQIRSVHNKGLRGFVMPAPISLLHVIVATLRSEAIFAYLMVLLLWILLLLLLEMSDWLEGFRRLLVKLHQMKSLVLFHRVIRLEVAWIWLRIYILLIHLRGRTLKTSR